ARRARGSALARAPLRRGLGRLRLAVASLRVVGRLEFLGLDADGGLRQAPPRLEAAVVRAVPPLLLGAVQERIGRLDEPLPAPVATRLERRQPDRGRHAHLARLVLEAVLLDRLADPL